MKCGEVVGYDERISGTVMSVVQRKMAATHEGSCLRLKWAASVLILLMCLRQGSLKGLTQAGVMTG